ncbi:2193_t:CDS:2 [Paraglomus brasilianum]|uniref:2193_t:CDS:1 n=1 Tax=Paraglomus brasilianum TaxID=144538 RepID=A0A9N9FVQ3_9GLOM|nr:2193_t:CDS:2 [Paraglomus brasilianum]
MTVNEIWAAYKRSRDGDHFTDNVTLVFVPTAAGARGYDAVRQLLSRSYDRRVVDVKEKVLFSTVSNNALVEETETTISFLTGECGWLIPGVDSRHAVDARIVIPMVTSATFENDRISSIRLYWDQASVLKQLRLISDKSSWPIVGERQIDTVRDMATAHLNPHNITSGVAQMDINQGPPRRNIHTSSRVLQPGGTGGKSSVFDTTAPNEPTNTKYNANKNASQFAIADDHDDNASVSSGVVEESHRRNIHTSSRVLQPGGTGGKSSVFDTTPNELTNTKYNANKNASQFTIADDHDDNASVSSGISGSTRRPGKSQFESSVVIGDDTGGRLGDNDPVGRSNASMKPSSRVLRPPGGGSSFTFG